MADTTNYGWTKPTIGGSADTWGTTLNTLADDIDADLKTVSDASKNASNLTSGSVPSARGGAGTVSGIMKANGSGVVSAATSSVDYAPATSGSSILYGNGSGGFSSVSVGTGLSFSGGTLATNLALSNISDAGSIAAYDITISASAPSGTLASNQIWIQYS
jgi:hypothetical protein